MRKLNNLGRGFRWATACTSAVLLAAFAMAGPAVAAGATLYVANNGVDDLSCGPEGQAPCRSIGRAIAHASAGDTIVVGPGVYGDINRNEQVDPTVTPGEESPLLVPLFTCPTLSVSANLALIQIDKPLTIVSRDGAASTVIDAGGQFPENYIAVNVAADGVVFGKRGKGFTLRNATVGVWVDPGVADAAVQGNLAECQMGFVAGSCEQGGAMASGTVFKGNTSEPDSLVGFLVSDNSAVVSGNLAKASFFAGYLVLAGADTVITKNLAVDGLGAGFLVSATAAGAPAFNRNAAVGNMDAGLLLGSAGDAAMEVTLEKNSFFANGVHSSFSAANCGLAIQNPGPQTLTVNADGNYWGAATGPGTDPADAAGGSCVAGPVTLNLTEWAASEIRVKPPTK